jgi:DoxX-like protein
MSTKNSFIERKRLIIGKRVIIMSSLMLIVSAGAKFAHIPRITTDLGAMGFDGGKLVFIAILEVLGALLFLVPATRSVGLLLLSSFMGGAIATHLQHGHSIIQPAFVLFLIWVGAWLHHPQVLWSLPLTTPAKDLVASKERRESAPQEI